jgi:hypothetical protein
MYFPHAFRKSFLPIPSSGSIVIASSGTTASLSAGQIGFFDASSYSALTSGGVAPFIIAQGSYYTQDKITPVLGGYQESYKSKVINPKNISRVIKVLAKQPVNQVVQVQLISGVTQDFTYRLRVDIKGSPALRFLNHQLYRTLDGYTGCPNTTNPTYQRDGVPVLLSWANEINSYPTTQSFVQARVYVLKMTGTVSANATGTTGSVSTSANNVTTLTAGTVTLAVSAAATNLIGTKAVGQGLPANSFVTSVVAGTSVTITYPPQAVAPAITTGTIKFYTDTYTTAGLTPTIPNTNYVNGFGSGSSINNGVATGLTSVVYTPIADAATISVDAHIEFNVAYLETQFGNSTFTPTDHYEIEPLQVYASVTDESGNPCLVSAFNYHAPDGTGTIPDTNLPYLSSHGFEIQTPVQAFGKGEKVLREMILDGRYLQNNYPDSSRVESFRMREIEADPGLLTIDRYGYYDRLMILHNISRKSNPTGTYDNDQYLLVIHVPKGTDTSALTTFLTNSITAAGNSIPTNSAGGTFEQY